MLKAVRDWARRYTSQGRYSPVGIAFHWGMVAMILFMLWLGWHMGRLDAGGEKRAAYEIHILIGMTALFFGVSRLTWRIIVPGPINDADRETGIKALLAKATHVAFYGCFIGLPLSGWIMWSAFAQGGTIEALGFAFLPALPVDTLAFEMRALILEAARLTHQGFVILLLLLIPAHAAAALKHHFWDEHDVLTAMLPEMMTEDSPTGPQQSAKPQ
jgi:cytochrome b561